jgi:hypothetical protein
MSFFHDSNDSDGFGSLSNLANDKFPLTTKSHDKRSHVKIKGGFYKAQGGTWSK